MGARVFISSCQREQRHRDIATKVAALLIERGYDPYIAINEQTSFDAKENIFEKLKNCEYFLFIDFKEDSLFTHQELGIASFLQLPLMAFKEKDAMEQRGMAYAMQLNAKEFETVDELISLINEQLSDQEYSGKWLKDHRNEIVIEQEPKIDTRRFGNANFAESFIFVHLRVHNINKHTHARGCTGILTHAIHEDTGQTLLQSVADLKWENIAQPTANLYRHSEGRFLAALCIQEKQPSVGCIYVAMDNMQIPQPCFYGPGKFLLKYTVLSENFPDVSAEFRLTLGAKISDFKFTAIE